MKNSEQFKGILCRPQLRGVCVKKEYCVYSCRINKYKKGVQTGDCNTMNKESEEEQIYVD